VTQKNAPIGLNHLDENRKERTTSIGLGCFEVWIIQQKSFDSIF